MDRYSCEAVNVMWGDLYDSWVAGNEKKLPIWYKASDVADLAKRVLKHFEPKRLAPSHRIRPDTRVLIAELEQIVKEGGDERLVG